MAWNQLAAELLKIPPVTRYATISAVVIAVPLFLHFYSPYIYTLDLPTLKHNYQFWRLYTSLWVPWRLDDPLSWLFQMVMLYRHLRPVEEKSYHRRLPDMLWQFFWSMAALMALCYPLKHDRFWTSLLGFIVYFSSRLSPNESVSLYGLITVNVQWFPYVLVAFNTASSPSIGCGTVAGLIVAQALFMLDYEEPELPTMEPKLRRHGMLRAPDMLTRLLVTPEVQRNSTVRKVYGTATAPAGRGLGDGERGANVPGSSSGYQWGKGHKLGEN
ncbi:hypothetical protein M408DRAFT_325530 [Serendipita vermifera MAFF 305830]|uniref:Derlin n=1 Tax=Serendipita vermifera MAFF 305830 TaxID=933852 RepID=A0A0C3BAY6_SERVB|nr:hypothetical protein M408DRAFT_325530 [Serendipita vermifera MAFF 305830]